MALRAILPVTYRTHAQKCWYIRSRQSARRGHCSRACVEARGRGRPREERGKAPEVGERIAPGTSSSPWSTNGARPMVCHGCRSGGLSVEWMGPIVEDPIPRQCLGRCLTPDGQCAVAEESLDTARAMKQRLGRHRAFCVAGVATICQPANVLVGSQRAPHGPRSWCLPRVLWIRGLRSAPAKNHWVEPGIKMMRTVVTWNTAHRPTSRTCFCKTRSVRLERESRGVVVPRSERKTRSLYAREQRDMLLLSSTRHTL